MSSIDKSIIESNFSSLNDYAKLQIDDIENSPRCIRTIKTHTTMADSKSRALGLRWQSWRRLCVIRRREQTELLVTPESRERKLNVHLMERINCRNFQRNHASLGPTQSIHLP